MTKQILIVRKDLNMRKGKISSQCSHASIKVFFDRMIFNYFMEDHAEQMYQCAFTPEMREWMDGIFTKICVSVNSEQKLLALKEQAEAACIPCALITDCGLTEFHGVPTITCLAIGPDNAEKIDLITGGLPLL